MDVVGGVYLELCEMPAWRAWYGSGGRAASLLAATGSTTVRLHTYETSAAHTAAIRANGVEIIATKSQRNCSFSYLHPLSAPAVVLEGPAAPAPPALEVTAPSVLRFGLVEGDALVHAERAVYDPQSPAAPAFHANGSTAGTLALVANELEVHQFRADPLGVPRLPRGVDVLVEKSGVHGAWVHEHGKSAWVPPYRSTAVFKIGTGDVFSAAFYWFWAVQRLSAVEAANLASRWVSHYAESKSLSYPGQEALQRRLPWPRIRHPLIGLVATPRALTDHWLVHEARGGLSALGVQSALISPENKGSAQPCDAQLVLADTMSTQGLAKAIRARVPSVLFSQATRVKHATLAGVALQTDDWTTALYSAVWLSTHGKKQ